MKCLVVKTSSMGDIIHAIPALVDAKKANPSMEVTWLTEEAFAPMLRLHPLIDHVIVVNLRRWRREIFKRKTWTELKTFLKALRQDSYDMIIDAQGLMKSALWTRIARGKKRCGYDWTSTKEKLAVAVYHTRVKVPAGLHAIDKIRQLFSKSFNYALPEGLPDYGWKRSDFVSTATKPYILLVHGTTWDNKCWPEAHWRALIPIVQQSGYEVHICWGSPKEYERSLRIAEGSHEVTVCPRLSYAELFAEIANATGVISVDTGISHIARALNIPTIAIFGPSSVVETGVSGPKQRSLSSSLPCAPCMKRVCQFPTQDPLSPPCMAELTPQRIWHHFQLVIQ